MRLHIKIDGREQTAQGGFNMKRNRLFVLRVSALLLAIALVLAGCSKNNSGGGSSSGGSGGNSAAKSSGRETPASDFAYDATADGTGVVITKYTGNGGKVVIPSKIEDLPVVQIKDYVFMGSDSNKSRPNGDAITELVIPNSVVTIGDALCHSASSLTKVTLGNGLKIIPGVAFRYCENLTTVNLPDTVESIGGEAFRDCGELTNLSIPDSITSVKFESGAFRGCGKLPLKTRQRLKELGYTSSF
jgi:hypothetical protein